MIHPFSDDVMTSVTTVLFSTTVCEISRHGRYYCNAATFIAMTILANLSWNANLAGWLLCGNTASWLQWLRLCWRPHRPVMLCMADSYGSRLAWLLTDDIVADVVYGICPRSSCCYYSDHCIDWLIQCIPLRTEVWYRADYIVWWPYSYSYWYFWPLLHLFNYW